MSTKTIRLYGALGEKFGRVWRFNVQSPAEAVRALCSQLPGFKKYLAEHSAPGYRVLCDTDPRNTSTIAVPTSAATIRIVPVVCGAGRGVGQIFLGAALMAALWWAPGFNSVALGSTMWNTGMAVGVSLVLGGVSQALTKPPSQAESVERPDNKPSYAFDGAVNTAAQGNPVPVCYGELIVGSQVVSAGLSTEQVAA